MKQHGMKRMFAAKKKASILELFIYSEIGEDWYGGGITPQSVTDSVKLAKENGGFDSITVHLNSPGGNSFDGVAIHNILRQQKVPINVIVEGLAASAAFTIAMAGDSIQICDGAMMMLHNAYMFAMGDAAELRKTADLLDQVSGTLRDIYSKRSGMSADEVTALMNAETWLAPQEAVDKGFADSVMSTTPEKSKEAKSLASQFNLAKMFQKVPDVYKPKADVGCQCPCDACPDDCENCTHDDCDCVGCDCEQNEMENKLTIQRDQVVITAPFALSPEHVQSIREAWDAAQKDGKPIVLDKGWKIEKIETSRPIKEPAPNGSEVVASCEQCGKPEDLYSPGSKLCKDHAIEHVKAKAVRERQLKLAETTQPKI